jgi:hypothetical protein
MKSRIVSFGGSRSAHLTTLFTTAALWLAGVAHVSATSLLYEPFPTSYGNGSTIGSSASVSVWSGGNGTSAAGNAIWVSTNQVPTLTYSGLAKTTGSGGDYAAYNLTTTLPSSNKDRTAPLSTAQTLTAGQKIYCSFLINVQTTPNAQKLIAYLRSDTGGGTPGSLGI